MLHVCSIRVGHLSLSVCYSAVSFGHESLVLQKYEHAFTLAYILNIYLYGI